MKVQFVRERSFQAVGPNGPLTTVFAIGDIVDLPEIHSQMVILQGDAKAVAAKPAKDVEASEQELEAKPKPAAKRK